MNWDFINTSINTKDIYNNFSQFANNTAYYAAQSYAPWFGGIFGFAAFIFSVIGIATYLESGRSTIFIVSMIVMMSSIFYNVIASPILAVFLIIWAAGSALIVFRAFVKSG